jgi:hypothetical protein
MLRAGESHAIWFVTEVKKASCAVGEELVLLPDDVRPGDIIECHGVKQRATYEFGAYALERLE